MRALKYTYRRDGVFVVGFLSDYPDYAAQVMTKVGLVENLKDLLIDLESGEAPYIRRVGEPSFA